MPLFVPVRIAVVQLGWPRSVKSALIPAVSFQLMLASDHWLVRATVIGAVLNGRPVRKLA
jgi:hypothetical protein